MANFLEIVPTTDGSYALPPLLMPPADWLKVSDLHFDSPDQTLEIPSQYPDTLPAPCQTCAAWFHYPKDQFGGDVPGGVWILCIAGPCEGAPAVDWQFVNATQVPGWTAGCAFDIGTTRVLDVVSDMVKLSAGARVPFTVAWVAAECWKYGATTLFAAQGPADGYAVGCAPGPTGNPCVNGYYYDTQQEACIPLNDITGHIPPLPIGQGGGGKTGGKGGGNGGQQPDDPELDEIGRCCVQTNNNLVLIQQEIQALQNSIMGTGQPLDPVTCGQLTLLFVTLNGTISQIATAITAAAKAAGSGVDLTPITTDLDSIASDLSTIATALTGGAAPPLVDQPIDDSFAAFMKQTIAGWVADGTIDAADAQPLL